MIKGNAAEIGALANSNEVSLHEVHATLSWLVSEKHIFFVFQVKVQGVDSLGVFANASGVVRTLARKYRS